MTTHLHQNQIEKLNVISKELKVSKAVLIREAVQKLIEKYEDKQLDIGIK